MLNGENGNCCWTRIFKENPSMKIGNYQIVVEYYAENCMKTFLFANTF